MKQYILPLLFVLTTTSTYTFAQGCSDAGFCTMPTTKNIINDTSETKKSTLKLGYSLGLADKGIKVSTTSVGVSHFFSKKLSADIKINHVTSKGKYATVGGLSDVFLNANYMGFKKTTLTIGIKVPLSDGNIRSNNKSYPINYQPSLGTLDLLLGANYKIKRFIIAVGLQQPLTQNKNTFYTSIIPNDSFITTNKFIRQPDVLIRLSYPFYIYKKIKLTPSILPIYHMCNDIYTDTNNVQQYIKNSAGLTLNTTLFISIPIQQKWNMEVSMGSPLIVRDVRPDGLTRSFVGGVELQYKF